MSVVVKGRTRIADENSIDLGDHDGHIERDGTLRHILAHYKGKTSMEGAMNSQVFHGAAEISSMLKRRSVRRTYDLAGNES